MNILVTGGLGVNGAFATRALLENGHSIVVVDRQKDTSLLGPVADDIELQNIDIQDIQSIGNLLAIRKIDTVVHMAALVSGIQDDPLKGFTINALGTVQLMDAALQAGVKRFVYTSSRAVYGEIEGVHAHPSYKPVNEDMPLSARNVYDVTKLAGELMGRNFAKLGMQFLALRFATIYGPGKLVRHGNMGIFSRIIENAMLGLPLTIEQGGDERDDIIYVGDVARACVAAVEHEEPSFDAYNISSGKGQSLQDFCDAVKVHLPAVNTTIGPGLDYFNAGVRYAGVLDNTRAKIDLDFEPSFDLKTGVRDYIAKMEELGLSPMAT